MRAFQQPLLSPILFGLFALTAAATVQAGDLPRPVAAGDALLAPVGLGSTEVENLRWSDAFALSYGCDGSVLAIATAANGDIYLGGNFRSCATVIANGLIRYDRVLDQWSAVASTEGQGVQGYVTALAIEGDSLYVAGGFEQVQVGSPVAAANVAKFDLLTEQWSPLASSTGNGVDGDVRAMALDQDGHLYLAGLFAQANVGSPISAPGLARWDAGMQQWSTPGTPPAGGGYHALIWHQNHLIAGGPGGIRIWSADSGWRTHGGPNGVVYALAATGSDIYAGGYWMQIFAGTDTTIDSGGIGRWSMNEERWFGVGDGLQRTFTESPQVNALAIHDGKLIAGGFFFSSGGTTPVQGYHLLSWSLSAEHWETVDSQLGSGAGGAVSAIATDGPDVLLGGGFGFLGPPEAPTRAYRFGIWQSDLNLWEGSDAGAGQPLIGGAGELTELNGTIYAIGSFGQAGDVPVKSLARWNGSTWDRVGTVDNEGGFELTAIHAFQGKIYLSGRFSADSGPGLLSGVRLVSWDPASGDWQSIGEFGNDPPEDFPLIYAIKSIGDDLYVGGYFRNVTDQQGTVNTSYLARWNVTTGQWSPVGNDGEGVSQFVSSMVAVGTDLYVGGSFAEVNLGSSPVTAHGVARWDGSQWHSLTDSTGEGTSGVYSLASDGDFLYVGGRFTAVAGVNLPALRVARWRLDGGGWEAMSGGIGNPSPFGNVDFVFSLAAVGNWIYAAGRFDGVENDSVSVNNIARRHRDGGSWRSVGSGVEPSFSAGGIGNLLAVGEDLYASGQFWLAGNHSSFNIASYATRGELDLSITGSGGGRVSSNPSGLNCTDSCIARFEWDQPIVLTAQPFASSQFVGWSGDCSGTGPCVVDFDRARFVGAEFASQSDLFADDFE